MKIQERSVAGEFKIPIATVDVALFTLREDILQLLLVKRELAPFAGAYALPGGFIHADEDADAGAAARRILAGKASLTGGYFLEQLYTFSGAARDPRGWSISIVYYAVVPEAALPQHGPWTLIDVRAIPRLPFDHNAICVAALDRLRGKGAYSSLPAFLLARTFTLGELQTVYECVIGERLDKKSFRRKIDDLDVVERVPGKLRRGAANRPAQLYRLSARTLSEFDRAI
ncbi:MAG TPA: NUDIX domain-containing protein [Candidatus Tumulicola sp.]